MIDLLKDELLLDVLDVSSDGVIVLRDGIVVYANATANDLARRDLTGDKASELFNAAALPVLRRADGETRLECFFFDRAVRMRAQKKGDLLLFSIRPDEQPGQNVTGAHLMSEMGNEIRSSLSVLMSVLETTLKDSPYWSVAFKNCCRILREISSTGLLFVGPDAFERDMETSNLVERLHLDGAELAEVLAQLHIRFTFQTDLPRLDAVLNRIALRRTFLTLIGEAIRRIGKHGEIAVSLAVTEGQQEAVITIREEKFPSEDGDVFHEITETDLNKAITSRIMLLSRGLILRERCSQNKHITTMIFPVWGTELDFLNIPSLEMKGISQILIELSGSLPSSCYEK